MSIQPTLSVPIFDGEVSMHAFGREHGCNFSFKGFDQSDKKHMTHAQIFEALASISSRVEAFCAPSPAKMNAEIVWHGEIPHMTHSGSFTNPGEEFHIYRGIEADGVRDLEPAYAYVMSAADCALIVAKSGDKIAAAHAGRNSIIDMNHLKGGEHRRYESIVHNMCMNVFDAADLACLQVWVGFSISAGPHFPHTFDDSRNLHNERMVRHIISTYGKECFRDDEQDRTLGWLNTKELIRRQFVKFGVSERNIVLDSMCTYSDQKDGEHIWYSNVRSGEFRNLVAVVVNH